MKGSSTRLRVTRLRVRSCFATYRDEKLVNDVVFCLTEYRLKPALALVLHALLAINFIALSQHQSAETELIGGERGYGQLRRIANLNSAQEEGEPKMGSPFCFSLRPGPVAAVLVAGRSQNNFTRFVMKGSRVDLSTPVLSCGRQQQRLDGLSLLIRQSPGWRFLVSRSIFPSCRRCSFVHILL